MKLLAKCWSISVTKHDRGYKFYLKPNFGNRGQLELTVVSPEADFQLGKEYYVEISEVGEIRPLIYDPEHYPEDAEI